jgi:hypothetical protein
LLVTQGAMFRSGILTSKQQINAGLRAESLASGAVKLIGLAAFAAWRGRGAIAVGSLPAIAPLLLRTASTLWRQKGLKPIVRGALIVGAAAAVGAMYVKTKLKARRAKRS